MLEKRETYIVVAQLSPEFTARLVDRWQELESGVTLPNFANPAEAARAWADQVEQNQVLQVANQEMAPKAAEYDAYLSDEGVCKISYFCNKHGIKVKHPGYILRDKGMLHQKKTVATQVGIKSGLLKNIVDRDNFEYVDSKGRSVEAHSAHVVVSEENRLLELIIDAYGSTAFRNRNQFIRAKSLIGGAA
jgi:hypothetical protein